MDLRILVPVLLLLAAPTVAASGEYDLDVAGGIDTPDRSFTWGGETFRASEVASVIPGEDLVLDVAGPSNSSVRVYLYDFERRIQMTKRTTPPDKVVFGTSDLSAGTYLATVYRDGTFEAVKPVSVAGYRVVLVDPPSRAEIGSAVTVRVRVEPLESAPEVHSVTVGAANAHHSTTAKADFVGQNLYEAELVLNGLSPGDYRLYAVPMGTRTLEGRHEGLGLSSGAPLTVTREVEDESSADGTGRGGDGGFSGAPVRDEKETAKETVEATPDSGDTETPTSQTMSATATASPGEGKTPLQPVLKEEGEEGEGGAEAQSTPGFGILVIVAVVAAAVLVPREG